MTITTLLENKSLGEAFGCTHGLSLYVETKQHKILFDMGPNALFLENAKALGVEVGEVNLAVLSHGHYDHGGGLELFIKRNQKAKIFAHRDAFLPHGVKEGEGYRDIGIDPTLLRRFPERFTQEQGAIDGECYLFSDLATEDYLTAASKTLLEKTPEGYESDPFRHEQNLLIRSQGKSLLLAGCAHRGIVNILRRAEEINGGEVDWVFAGFHLTNPGLGVDEPRELIESVGRELLQRENTRYVTGHCTGDGPYELLKAMLGDRLETMPTGSRFVIE